jgi:hypothetical protein
MIQQGRRWFTARGEPDVKPGQVVRLRSSARDPGFLITVDAVVQADAGWRVVFRRGDCTEHYRFLAWSGDASGGDDSSRGYTEEYWRSMLDEPEAVSDSWLQRFSESANVGGG